MSDKISRTKSLMSTARAARYLGRSRQWVWEKGRTGELQTFRHEGRYIYYLAEEIQELKDKLDKVQYIG